MSDSSAPSDHESLVARCGALLFVCIEPAPIHQIAGVLEVATSEMEQVFISLEDKLRPIGLRLQKHQGKVQLTTAPDMAEMIEIFLGLEVTSHLSRAALETLAIVAYLQPVTRPRIDSVRGVSCDGVMKSLLGKGLLLEIGRTEGPGRPILYGTSTDFLQHFGLNSLADLPTLNLAAVDEPGTTKNINP
jgi:segregation and condensation protein B